MRLCPVFPPQYVGDLAWAHLLLDRQEETIAMAQEAIKIDPDYIYSYVVLAITYVELGRAQDACAAAQNIPCRSG